MTSGAHTGAMSSDQTITAIDVQDGGSVQCWCCDISGAPDRMVHLSNHPEVNLCLRCAHFVHRKARKAGEIEDDGKGGPAVFARDRLRTLRTEVVRRGWHQNRFVGDKLRWLDKYLP